MKKNIGLNSGHYLLIVAIFLFMGCDKNDPGSGSTTPSLDLATERQNMAIHVGDHFIKPAFENLQLAIQSLQTALR